MKQVYLVMLVDKGLVILEASPEEAALFRGNRKIAHVVMLPSFTPTSLLAYLKEHNAQSAISR